MRYLFLMAWLALLPLAASADTPPAPAASAALPAAPTVHAKMIARLPNCAGGMQENVNISINFNIRAKSFTEAKAKFDEKMKQIGDFSKQQNIGKFDLQSMNYNINAQANYENGAPEQVYQLNGSANYMLDSDDSAFKLGEFLTQQKFQVGVNVSKYRNGACNNFNNPMID